MDEGWLATERNDIVLRPYGWDMIGARLEGVAPSMYIKSGVRYDQLNFGITREQWLELRSTEATA